MFSRCMAVVVVFLLARIGGWAEDVAVDAGSAFARLMDGNQRFVTEHFSDENRRASHRVDIAQAQHPFAVVVACSDSREAVEIIFDQGLGDLFVIRVAGHVIDDVVLGSVEYAVEHLGVQLVLVMGHERCGAVGAALQGGEAAGHIGSLVEAIRPAFDGIPADTEDRPDLAVRANICQSVNQLVNGSSLLGEKSEAGAIQVLGACYDLDTGLVEVVE